MLPAGVVHPLAAAVAWVLAGGVIGGFDYRTSLGLGPLRGRAFSGAIGGTAAGLGFMLLCGLTRNTIAPWYVDPVWGGFFSRLYCYACGGALVGTIAGCIASWWEYRGLCTAKGRRKRTGRPNVGEDLPAQQRREKAWPYFGSLPWWRNRWLAVPGWAVALLFHVAVFSGVTALLGEWGGLFWVDGKEDALVVTIAEHLPRTDWMPPRPSRSPATRFR